MPAYTRREILQLTAGAVASTPVLVGGPRAASLNGAPRSVPPEGNAILYVATSGNDAWSGKLAAPNAARTDGPVATLGCAQQLVREHKTQQSSQPITVQVRGGKYYLEDTLVLGQEDSGSQEAIITYAAYPGEKPILSGGRRVTGWKAYQGRILRAELAGSKGGQWMFRQLFLNEKRQIRARWPNFDPQDPMYGGWAFMEGPAQKGSTTAFRYKPDTFQHHWAKPTQGEVTFYQGVGQWQATSPIKSVDEKNRIITLTRPGYQFDSPPWYEIEHIIPYAPYFVANLLEELDQPGEWCLDFEEGVLYFWPPSGALQSSDEVVVPALACLVDLQGASWVRFSGFTFTETLDGDNTQHLEVEGAGAMAWQPGWRYCGDAVHMYGTEHCTLDGNAFYAVGGNSIYLEGYNYRNIIRHNELSYGGANGICLLGTKLKHPEFNVVSDNHIHHIGVFNKYVGGIFAGVSNGNVFSHNRIEYVPHHAINLAVNPWGRNIVEYNFIRYACLQIMDTGAINMWMELPGRPEAERDGHVIRYNYIADIFNFKAAKGKLGPGGYSNGIYMDNFTSNCFVYGNIVVRAQLGLALHAGKNNLLENNIFVNCFMNLGFGDGLEGDPYWKPMEGFFVGNHIARNIFYQVASGTSDGQAGEVETDFAKLFGLPFREPPIYGMYGGWTERTLASCDNNLFFQGKAGKYALQDDRKVPEQGKVASLSQWRKFGYDRKTVIADPLFVDPQNDDYSLQPASPAFKLGFLPINIKAIGPRENDDGDVS